MSPNPLPAVDIPPSAKQTSYPEPFASLMAGRTKRKLGNFFGLTNFGVNLTQLDPGAISSVRHYHSKQDEFIFILQGTPTLVLGEEEFEMQPGDCHGFKAGVPQAHHLENRTDALVVYLEIGDRTPGDEGFYPYDDRMAQQQPDGSWRFTHKDGTPYE